MNPPWRVRIEADLFSTESGGLSGPITDGYRSAPAAFQSLDEESADQYFTTIFENVESGGDPGEQIVAVVAFISDLAEVYATTGTRFSLWHGRKIGEGRVVGTVNL